MRLIDADELLTAFPVDDEPTLTKACVRMTIQHMPTIEPVRKGKWEVKDGCVRCSECGEPMMEFNFCPSCGADMRGEDDD